MKETLIVIEAYDEDTRVFLFRNPSSSLLLRAKANKNINIQLGYAYLNTESKTLRYENRENANV